MDVYGYRHRRCGFGTIRKASLYLREFKMSRSTFLDGKLGQLQNLVKRDPAAYKEEFLQQHQYFLSELEIYKLDPAKKADHFSALISFLAHVAQVFPKGVG